ncbi:ABC transporter permease [Aeromicrobium sp. 50.2.37]|uniref:ABC transporter permease n=1 Tax=Aeromicrobium sp. 50.2.37 TaxID=2969305 RepID=UPI00214F9CF1|nr:ABC transporter permease [Aeromicrobium sp. 50.2.37]MCR4513350.1 ABC transporter permease [Aeromicrobium sp. 50.2.37]
MRTVMLASLRTHTRRYVAALLAVTIAVGFVVATNAIASAAKSGLSAGIDEAYRGADLVVGDDYGIDTDDVSPVLETAARQGDAATVIGSSFEPVTHDGIGLGSDSSIGTVSTDDRLLRQTVLEGRAPTSDDQALVDERTATSARISVGDELVVGQGEDASTVTVVGIAKPSSYLAADVYVPWGTLSALPSAYPDAVVYDVRGGDTAAATAALSRAVDAEVRDRTSYVDARVIAVNQGVDVISYVLLLFAAIAGFVAVLVIANTFTILFAQRTRDLALLRCVGATRRQVVRSVRVESFAVALVASTVGVLAGAGAGYGIVAAVRGVTDDRLLGTVSLSPTWMVAAFVGGIVVTVTAAWLPTRRVVRVSPLAALRPMDADVRTRAGKGRVALGVAAVLAGSAALVLAVQQTSMPPLLAGGMLSFVGVLLLGPVLVPALLRVAGRLLGRTGLAARLATANAVRNPRRSAATTASLLVGVTLTTAVLTGMASARGAMDDELEKQYPVDVALTGDGPVSAGTLDSVRATRGVQDAEAVPGVRATLEGVGEVPVLAPDDAALDTTRGRESAEPGRLQVFVPPDVSTDSETGFPETMTLKRAGRTVDVERVLVGSEWGRALVAGPGVVEALGGTVEPQAVWVRADDGADVDELSGTLGALARDGDLELTSTLEQRGWVEKQLDVLVWSVLGLLAVSVGIALVGIANTVGLSVLERGREHALLRALGLTRRQLRRMLAAEGLLLALVAAVLGTAVGVTYGWLGTLAVVRTAVADVSLVTPWDQLLAVVVVAALAGLAACVLPARRASRVAPAEGLTLD